MWRSVHSNRKCSPVHPCSPLTKRQLSWCSSRGSKPFKRTKIQKPHSLQSEPELWRHGFHFLRCFGLVSTVTVYSIWISLLLSSTVAAFSINTGSCLDRRDVSVFLSPRSKPPELHRTPSFSSRVKGINQSAVRALGPVHFRWADSSSSSRVDHHDARKLQSKRLLRFEPPNCLLSVPAQAN